MSHLQDLEITKMRKNYHFAVIVTSIRILMHSGSFLEKLSNLGTQKNISKSIFQYQIQPTPDANLVKNNPNLF